MSVLTEQIPLSYTINITNKTITFNGYTTLSLSLLKSISNDTLGQFIFTLGTATAVGASVSGNVLTLPTMPAGMAATDVLTIQYVNQASDPIQQTPLLPSGAATSAKQDTGNTSLSTIATNTGAGATATNQTNGLQKTQLTDGTTTPNFIVPGTAQAGQNAALVAGSFYQATFSTTAVGNTTAIDVSNFASASVQINSQGTSSTVTVQGSNDGTNWFTLASYGSNFANNGGTTSSTGIFTVALNARFFRLAVAGITAGTTAGIIEFFTVPKFPAAFRVSNDSGNLNVAIATGTNSIGNVGSNSATGAAVPANAYFMGIQNATGNLSGIQTAGNTGDNNGANAFPANGNMRWNLSGWDRERNNITGVVQGAGASAGASTSFTTYNAQRAAVILNVTAASASPSITVAINGVTSSGYVYPIITSTAITATGVYVLRIGPGFTPSANSVANDILPRTLQVVTTVAGTVAFGVDYLLGN